MADLRFKNSGKDENLGQIVLRARAFSRSLEKALIR
jgi:hypothetical protein